MRVRLWLRRMGLWPQSLAARTAMVLLLGLAVVQAAGLTIHALDRMDVQRLAQARSLAERVMGFYRAMVLTAPAEREAVLRGMQQHGPGLTVTLARTPPVSDLPPLPFSAMLRFWPGGGAPMTPR
ncbi:MAG: hypothetical protein M3Y41_16265 [Pseudomonadota bacterium]|nr:hypothetical protein [Pseudomonadota bacterium]